MLHLFFHKIKVIILPFAGFDIYGVLHTYAKKDVMKQVIVRLEEYLEVAKNNGTHQVSVVIDMDNFNLKQYAWKPGIYNKLNFFLGSFFNYVYF